MSVSSPRSPSEAPDITCIAPEPFEPIPLISDILRTGYCIPGSVFLVEGIDSVHTSNSKRWRAVRLMLGDGELCIQALLSAEMHRYVDQGEIAFGSYVKLERFRVEWKNLSTGIRTNPSTTKGKGKERDDQAAGDSMVYLVVDDLALVGWNNTLIDAQTDDQLPEAKAGPEAEPESDKEDDSSTTPRAKSETRVLQSFDSGIDIPKQAVNADDDDDFESMPDTTAKVTQNRQHLASSAKSTAKPAASTPRNAPDKPLKLTKLRSIPNLPYKQNWSVNVLAVISAISDVEPSGLPPYTQRQARLTDPSTDKHVLLTVFLDADQFAPKVGSVVLLLGVKNHRFDGGSLKKYVSDRPPEGNTWWYENPTRFDWCDVEGLRRWWVESQVI
ncbi:hypothetical protein M426DRAFT_321089 [Hypoxylon sp. CI-4A]|nr:hypothetical protein M426DRAFT_321089 [Hypoxylon sp. CI-4A]